MLHRRRALACGGVLPSGVAVECDRRLEGRSAGGPAQRLEERGAEREGQDDGEQRRGPGPSRGTSPGSTRGSGPGWRGADRPGRRRCPRPGPPMKGQPAGSSPCRRRRPRRKPYAASISTSARPRSRSGPGSSPAPMVNQPIASIWNGIHGPDPAREQRGREHRDRAEDEAEARAEDPAAQHHQEEHRLQAGRARAERPQRGARRGQHAQHRHRLGVRARTRRSSPRRRRPAGAAAPRRARARPARGRSPEWAVGEQRPAEGDHPDRADQGEGGDGAGAEADGAGLRGVRGRPRAAAPGVRWRARVTGSQRLARASRPGRPSASAAGPGSWRPAGRRRGRDDHLGRRAVRDDLALGQDHHPVGQLGGQLHVVGGQDDGVALGGQRRAGSRRRRAFAA